MAGFDKAKEAYKHVPRNVLQNTPLIKVHGLYIAGLYKPPYWIDQLLNITSISGTKAELAYYTAAYATVGSEKDGIFTFKDFSISSDITITNYSTSTSNVGTEKSGIFTFKDFDIGELGIMSYGNDYAEAGSDGDDGSGVQRSPGIFTFIDFNIKDDDITITNCSNIIMDPYPIVPVLNILMLTTTLATIN